MNTLHASLALLFAELTDGPSPEAAYMLNGGDPGSCDPRRSLGGGGVEAVRARRRVDCGPCGPRVLRARSDESLA